MITVNKPHYVLKLYYPFNDIRTKQAMEKILDNLHRISPEELEEITDKF